MAARIGQTVWSARPNQVKIMRTSRALCTISLNLVCGTHAAADGGTKVHCTHIVEFMLALSTIGIALAPDIRASGWVFLSEADNGAVCTAAHLVAFIQEGTVCRLRAGTNNT